MKLFQAKQLLLLLLVLAWLPAAKADPRLQTGHPALPLTSSQLSKLQHLFQAKASAFTEETPREHVVWHRIPIKVSLPIGTERMIGFPDAVQLGYDKTVLNDTVLKVQNNNCVLYLTAQQAFSTQRVQVKLHDSGSIILLDLSAQENASSSPIDVVLATHENKSAIRNGPGTRIDSVTQRAWPLSDATLMRFAVQQLYAPQRLLTQPGAIYRIPMHTPKTVPLVLDGSVIAMPLASWRGGDLFVTAVLVRNTLKQSLTLDPRTLNGHWKASSFFPQRVLAARGNLQDTTTVFLISHRPFVESF